MNFNVYLDDETGRKLQAAARRRGTTRNALIREAVQRLIEPQAATATWSRAVLEWNGDGRVRPFESYRAELLPPTDDPFA